MGVTPRAEKKDDRRRIGVVSRGKQYTSRDDDAQPRANRGRKNESAREWGKEFCLCASPLTTTQGMLISRVARNEPFKTLLLSVVCTLVAY